MYCHIFPMWQYTLSPGAGRIPAEANDEPPPVHTRLAIQVCTTPAHFRHRIWFFLKVFLSKFMSISISICLIHVHIHVWNCLENIQDYRRLEVSKSIQWCFTIPSIRMLLWPDHTLNRYIFTSANSSQLLSLLSLFFPHVELLNIFILPLFFDIMKFLRLLVSTYDPRFKAIADCKVFLLSELHVFR